MNQVIDEGILNTFVTEELESDKDFTLRLLGIFNSYVDELMKMGFSGSPEDMEALGRLAHKLRSSCASFGAMVLQEKLQELELATFTGDSQAVAELYTESIEIAAATNHELDQLLSRMLQAA